MSQRMKIVFLISLLALLGVTFAVVMLAPVDIPVQALPDYKKGLKRVVVSLSAAETDLRFHNELLSSFPEHSQILMILPEHNKETIAKELSSKSYASRVEILAYPTSRVSPPNMVCLDDNKNELLPIQVTDPQQVVHFPHGSRWAQDFFEPLVGEDGYVELMLPVIQKCFFPELEDSIFDLNFLQILGSKDFELAPKAYQFAGGNILIGELNGRRLAFVGGTTLKYSEIIRKTLPKTPDKKEILDSLRHKLAVDEVIIIGDNDSDQPKYFFHLDQTLIPLADGIVGVSKIVDEPTDGEEAKDLDDAREFLALTRERLSSLGFQVLDIQMSTENVLHFEHYINAIPYLGPGAGQRAMIMPYFPNRDSVADQRILKHNEQVFSQLGYQVTKVPVKYPEFRGGLHCLTNVID